MQAQLRHLQEERLKVINLLQQQREESFQLNERLEEHVELQVQQRLIQLQRELQEHFYEQTEALRSKVASLQEALEIMRKNEDVSDFEANDSLTNGSLKAAFLQLQVIIFIVDFITKIILSKETRREIYNKTTISYNKDGNLREKSKKDKESFFLFRNASSQPWT